MALITSTTRNHNHSSNVVGYESSRFRYVYYTDIIVPQNYNNIPVISATVTNGTFSDTNTSTKIQNGTPTTVYFKIIPQADSFTNTANTHWGTVKISNSTADSTLNITQGRTLNPGTYKLYVYTTESTFGWRYFKYDTLKLTVTYQQYTKCSAPTSVTIKQTIQKPGGTITIDWSGAKAGVGMTISKYGVRYKIGSGAWSSEETVTSSSTSDSHSFTLPLTATRGAYVQVSVKTKGSVTGYDSDYKDSSSTACKVNTLPSAPTVTVTIPSDGKNNDPLKIPYQEKRTVSVTAGSSNDDNQSPSVYYKKGEGDYIKLTNTLTIDKDSAGIYTFYTYDGLEYSSGVSKTFVANTSPPTVSIDVSGVSLNSNNTPQGTSYVISPTCTATKETNGQANGNTYTFNFHTCDANGNNKTLIKQLWSSSIPSMSVKDIRAHKNPTSTGYYYTIGVIRNDGIEDSSEAFSGNVYYVTKVPGLTFYNDKTAQDSGEYFSNKVQPSYVFDEGYNQVELRVLNPSKTQVYQATANGLDPQFSLTSLLRGSKYIFQARPKSETFTPAFYDIGDKTRVLLPNLGVLSSNKSLINPFTANEYILNFQNFLASKEPNITQYKLYGVNSDTDLVLQAKYGSMTSKLTTNIGSTLVQQDKAEFKVVDNDDVQELFNSDFGIDINQVSNTSVTMTLSITNLYGDTISATKIQSVCYVDSDTIPKVNDFNFDFKFNGSSVKYITEECVPIISNISATGYHDIKEVEVWLGSGTPSYQKKASLLNTTTPSGLSKAEIEFDSLSEMSKDVAEPYIKIRIKNTANQVSAWATIQDIDKPIRALVPGTGFIESASWDFENKIIVGSNVTSWGIDSLNNAKIVATIYVNNVVQDNFNINNQEFSKEYFEKTFVKNENEQTVARVKIGYTTYLYPLDDSEREDVYIEKYWETPEIIVYKASPTLSYRKNKVGINYAFPANGTLNDSSLVIGAHDTSKFIYLTDGLGNSVKIALKTEGATQLGQMTGFIIDGGSWDL